MTMYRVGPAGIPASLKTNMDAVLNKKFGTSTTYPPNTWPDNVNLLGPLPEKTASGVIASFSDGADDVPISSGLFSFTPKQAGTGTPSPSNPRAISGYTGATIYQTGKNLLSCGSADEQTLNQVDFTADGEGRYTISGTATGGSATFYVDLSTPYTIRTGDYLHIMNSAAVANCSFGLRTANSGIVAPAMTPANRIYSLASYVGQTVSRLSIYVANGGTFEGTITPMIINNNVATTFEAYKAKTPIVDTFGATVYGGSRATDGTLTSEYKCMSITEMGFTRSGDYFQVSRESVGAGELTNDNIICSCFPRGSSSADMVFWFSSTYIRFRDSDYSDVATMEAAIGSQEFCFPTATPTTSTLSALDISTYYGANNIYTDMETGENEVTYRADINMLIASLSGNRGLMMTRPQLEEITEENKEESPEVTEK